jgi:hypothetical protein
MSYLDVILRFFSTEDYSNREDVAILISDIFEENPAITIEEFKKRIRGIHRDFFRINKINRDDFAETLYKRVTSKGISSNRLGTVKNFIEANFATGFERNKHIEQRKTFIECFSTIKEPHKAVMKSMNELLDKMNVSFSLNLHGAKEYSGIDIVKSIKNATVGFQIKTRSDDISEAMILSEVTRAQNYKINGFVLVYARKNNRRVQVSIQAAFHIFKRLNDSRKIYCAIIEPELLAEVLRRYSISISS